MTSSASSSSLRGPVVWDAAPMQGAGDLAGLLDEPWMYEFDLGDGLRTNAYSEELLEVHRTRAAVAEPVAREALAAAGAHASAIDLACSEGWFSHRMLEWGAQTVTGVDIRPENIHRATLVRDRLGIDPERFALRTSDVFDLDPVQLGTFDVVLCFGLIYHLEDPIGALRITRALTRGVCIVESQLTEQVEPIRHGWGTAGQFMEQPASWAAYYEPAQLQESHPVAAHGGVVSFIPNRVALLEAMTAAGFSRVQPLVPATGNPQYVDGNRLVVAGWP
jgi:tRNA (mo5U34)-methyltransferase